jgi:hypothetical protein
VIIRDFDVFGACFLPPEAQPELIVYTDAVLAGPVSFKTLQSVPGWYTQVLQSAGDFQLS